MARSNITDGRSAAVSQRARRSTSGEVAARQRSPETRRTCAAVYRSFDAFLGPQAAADELTAEAVRAYRDALERAGRSPATVGSR